jgi:hypothetical protein
MQAWARPATLRSVDNIVTEPVNTKDAKALPVAREQFKDIIDIVCCANCRSDIQLFEESEAICTQCELSYEVVSGVINFSKYAKRTKHKLAGSS